LAWDVVEGAIGYKVTHGEAAQVVTGTTATITGSGQFTVTVCAIDEGAREGDEATLTGAFLPASVTQNPTALWSRAFYSAIVTGVGAGTAALSTPTTYDYWQATSGTSWTIEQVATTTAAGAVSVTQQITAVGIGGHNLGTVGATVSISINGNVMATRQPTSDAPMLVLFDVVVSDRISVTVTIPSGADMPRIATIAFGEALVFERSVYGGHSPFALNENQTVLSNRSEGGQFLGASVVRRGFGGSLSINHLRAAWAREFMPAFIQGTESMPFFLAWRPETYPDEVAYCYHTAAVSLSNMGMRDYMAAALSLEGMS
jgi:hypothetical protein